MEPEPQELDEAKIPETRNVLRFPAASGSAAALRLVIDELTLDDVEKDPGQQRPTPLQPVPPQYSCCSRGQLDLDL